MNAPFRMTAVAAAALLGVLASCHPSPVGAPPPRTPAPTMGIGGAEWLVRPEREAEEQPERMLDALHIPPGASVADVGAGVGYHSWRLARRVGPAGQVWATDLQPEMLDRLRGEMERRGMQNVRTVRSSDSSAGLPDASVDLVLMVDVYHELAQPLPFLDSVRRALRPGGRLALVEFRSEDRNIPIRPEHRMTAQQTVAELQAARFRLVERQEFLPWQHLFIFAPER